MSEDAIEREQKIKRGTPTPPDKLSAAIDDLYSKIAQTIWDRYKKGQSLQVTINFTCIHANDVVAGVIDRLKTKDWQAKHYFNDGYNHYDHFEISPPKDYPIYQGL